jgi:hypothetical protein
MARLPLVIYPDTILTTRSTDVTEIDQALAAINEADPMLDQDQVAAA